MTTNGPGLHERFDRADAVKAGSERAFGVVFAGVFALVGLWPLLGGGGVRAWAFALSGGFAAVALLRPALLRPLNVLWFRFGQLLHAIVNPLVMGLLFYCTVLPTGLALRLLGKDPLRLRFERDAGSYWIRRDPPGPPPDTMRRQF